MPSQLRPRVLVSNDDGPPGPESPFIEPFIDALEKKLGWDIKVAVPTTQKSWIGKGFVTKDIVPMTFYDRQSSQFLPSLPSGATSGTRYWNCLEGTPAACVNIGLNHLWEGEIDLVLSGPNFGRNSSNAMVGYSSRAAARREKCHVVLDKTLNSGTVGAALDAVLCGVKAIALSFAFYGRDFPPEWIESAVESAVGIVDKLWKNWPNDGKVDLWNINIPLCPPPTPPIHITHIHKGGYGSLYKPTTDASKTSPNSPVSFKWSPTFQLAKFADPEPGSDGFALQHKHISVSPMVANFQCVETDAYKGILEVKEHEEGEAVGVKEGEDEKVLGEKLEQPGLNNKM